MKKYRVRKGSLLDSMPGIIIASLVVLFMGLMNGLMGV